MLLQLDAQTAAGCHIVRSSWQMALHVPKRATGRARSTHGVRLNVGSEAAASQALAADRRSSARAGATRRTRGRRRAGRARAIPKTELSDLVVPKRTLARRRSDKELLTVEETDKALRLKRVATLAEQVFGEPAKAHRWMRKPKRGLSGETPLAFLASEKRRTHRRGNVGAHRTRHLRLIGRYEALANFSTRRSVWPKADCSSGRWHSAGAAGLSI